MEDYIVLADIPKVLLESEEIPGLRTRNQSPSPCRDQRIRTYRLVVYYMGQRGRDESHDTCSTRMHIFCIPNVLISLVSGKKDERGAKEVHK